MSVIGKIVIVSLFLLLLIINKVVMIYVNKKEIIKCFLVINCKVWVVRLSEVCLGCFWFEWEINLILLINW